MMTQSYSGKTDELKRKKKNHIVIFGHQEKKSCEV